MHRNARVPTDQRRGCRGPQGMRDAMRSCVHGVASDRMPAICCRLPAIPIPWNQMAS